MREQFEFYQMVGKHLDRRKLIGWFLWLALLFAAATTVFEWLFIADLQLHYAMPIRAAIGLIGANLVLVVVYYKALRPAQELERQEIERLKPK